MQNLWTVFLISFYCLSLQGQQKISQELVSPLGNRDPKVRAKAANILAIDKKISLLTNALDHKNPVIRWETIHILYKLRNEPQTLFVFVKALSNKDPYVKKIAHQSLVAIGANSIPPLLKIIQQRKKIAACVAALKVLEDMGLKAQSAVEIVASRLYDKNYDLAWQASKTLSKLGKVALPYLAQMLSNKNKDYRAARIIKNLKIPIISIIKELSIALTYKDISYKVAKIMAKIGDPAIPYLLKHLQDKRLYVKDNAIRAFATMKTTSKEVRQALVKATFYKKEWAARRAAEALGKMGALTYVKKSIVSEDKNIQKLAIYALVNMKPGVEVLHLLTQVLQGSNLVMQKDKKQLPVIKMKKSAKLTMSPKLVIPLFANDDSIQAKVADYIEELGAKEVNLISQGLTKNLHHPSKRIRQAILHALAKANVPTEEHLLKMAGDSSSEIRTFAVGNLKTTTAVDPLINALEDPDSEVRKAAITALGNIKVQSDRVAMVLANAIYDENWQVRLRAISALKNKGAKAARPLGRALRSMHWRVQMNACWALEKLGPKGALAAPFLIEVLDNNAPQVPFIIEQMNSGWDVRIHAATALGAMGEKAHIAIPALIRISRAKYWVTRHHAAQALANFGKIAPLVKQFAKGNRSTKFHILNALRLMKAKALAAKSILAQALKHKDKHLRSFATLVFVEMKGESKKAKELLKPALDDSFFKVRIRALKCFANMGSTAKGALPKLFKMFEKDSNTQVRLAALIAIKAIAPKDKRLLSALQQALKKKERAIQIAAIESLQHWGMTGVKILITALDSKNGYIQKSAIKTLGLMGTDAIAAAEHLSKKLSKKRFIYSSQTTNSLQKINKAWLQEFMSGGKVKK